MITIYNSASAFYWYPLKFELQGDHYQTIYQKYFFNNGMIFNGHAFLLEGMDYKNNNKTSLFLTDMLSSSEIFKNKNKPEDSTDLTIINSTISNKDGFVLTQLNLKINKKDIKVLNKTERKKLSDVDLLKFVIDKENDYLLYIENQDGQVLQCNSESDNSTFFTTKATPAINKQRFEYFLNNSGEICFFLAGSNASKCLSLNSNNNLVLSSVSLKNQFFRIPNEIIFKLDCYNKINSDEDYIVDSKIVEYNNKPIDPIDSLYKDSNIFNTPYLQNFLLMFPTENPIIIDDEAVYIADYNGLKNYQNPDYDYVKGPYFSEDNPYIRRIYWQIYSGSNQENGYDDIYLGYTSNSTKLVLRSDRETEFQYSPASQRVALSSSNLIESGSIAGEHPLTSDRIYGLSVNYKNTLPELSQPVSFFRETGTWLCSWLKGTQNGPKKWMDRYYNSAYLTTNEALSSGYLKYNERLDPSKPYIYDIESTLTLEPGARYKYFRQGIKSSQEFINYLDYTSETKYGSKKLHVNTWTSNEAIDSSKYNNNGIVINRNTIQPDKTSYSLYGSNHIVFPSTSDLLETQKITVSLWINVDDWSKIYGWQIFGNYYNGGWGLINNSGQISPLLTIVENNGKRSYSVNYRSGLTDSYELSNEGFINPKNSYFEWVLRLPDFSYWLIDTSNFVGYRVDSNGKILNTDNRNIKKSVTSINQVLLDKDMNLVIFDSEENLMLKINSLGKHVSLTEAINKPRIDFRSNGNLVKCDSDISIIDNNDNLWEIVGENLYICTNYIGGNSNYYKDKQIKAHVGKCQSITCDSENNLWFITKDNTLIKYNTTTDAFDVNKKLLDDFVDANKMTDESYPYSHIGIIRTSASEFFNNCKELQKELYDVICVVDTINFKLYFFQTSGQLIKRTDLRTYIQDESIRFETYWKFSAKGDFTGFDYIRKYLNPSQKKLSWNLKTSDHLKEIFENLTLDYDVSQLPPKWHNFSLVFDGLAGKVIFYIDSIKVNEKNISKNSLIYYEYLSPLLLGATTVKNTSLNDLVGIEDGYKFIGKISDLRIYNKSFNSSEIEQLYFSNNKSISRSNLNWNISVGERNYVEKINHFFKYQLPGSKTNYYNINIHNLKVSNKIKKLIEESIQNNIKTVSPYNTFLNKINWL
jgi:hypothetical protein